MRCVSRWMEIKLSETDQNKKNPVAKINVAIIFLK